MHSPLITPEKLAEKLSKGLGGWLMFEHHSHRADLFSEKYLASGIGNILAGNYRTKILAEYTHPVLKERVAGRPPQIDFVISEESDSGPSIKLAIESKWLGTRTSSTPKIGDILWDIVRLELLNYQFKTQTLLVIAGKKSQTDLMFKNYLFIDKTPTGKKRTLLPNRNSPIKLDLIGCSLERLKLYASYTEKYKRVQFPSEILISGARIYPKDCVNFENEVCVWVISSNKDSKRYNYSELMERIAKRESQLLKRKGN